MELPFTCSCGFVSMVDIDHLAQKPLDRVYSQKGYVCQGCKAWRVVYVSCPNLENSLKKLAKLDAGRREFPYFFQKTLKRARELRSRMENNGPI